MPVPTLAGLAHTNIRLQANVLHQSQNVLNLVETAAFGVSPQCLKVRQPVKSRSRMGHQHTGAELRVAGKTSAGHAAATSRAVYKSALNPSHTWSCASFPPCGGQPCHGRTPHPAAHVNGQRMLIMAGESQGSNPCPMQPVGSRGPDAGAPLDSTAATEPEWAPGERSSGPTGPSWLQRRSPRPRQPNRTVALAAQNDEWASTQREGLQGYRLWVPRCTVVAAPDDTML